MYASQIITTPGIPRFAREIDAERQQQLAKFGEQKHPDGTGAEHYVGMADEAKYDCQADPANPDGPEWALILLEEVYEALAETDVTKLRGELIQAAAVIAAWIRDIDTRPHPMICDHCHTPIPVDENRHTWHGPIPEPGQPNCATPRYHLGLDYPDCRTAGAT